MTKILCLQLARYGDIFQAWPSWRALKRMHPQVHLSVVVRERFQSAARLSPDVDEVIPLPGQEIFGSLLNPEAPIESAVQIYSQWIEYLKTLSFDQVINQSYNPLSSFLTHSLSHEKTRVTGYSRHEDGYFYIPDFGSRYFYAQVGPGRSNRFHVTDLMALTAGVELQKEDHYFSEGPTGSKIFIHLGASESHKRLSPSFWAKLILFLRQQNIGAEFILLGAKDDVSFGEDVQRIGGRKEVINLVGQTTWTELGALFRAGGWFLGADSGPMQLATRMNLQIFNLSFGQVSHWETGPRSTNSRVYRMKEEPNVLPEELQEELRLFFHKQDPVRCFWWDQNLNSYRSSRPNDSLSSQILEYLYLDKHPPMVSENSVYEGLKKLVDLNDLYLLALIDPKHGLANRLEVLDEALEVLSLQSEELGVFIRWLTTEKLCVPPGSPSKIRALYRDLHMALKAKLKPYMWDLETPVASKF